jgi:hypothetical protein
VNRQCLGRCGRSIPKGGYCSPCRTAKYGGTRERGYTAEWVALSKRMRAEHVERYGYWCPGWQAEAHPSRDLVLDHGPPPQVMCRGCNGRRAAVFDKNSPAPKGGDREVPA